MTEKHHERTQLIEIWFRRLALGFAVCAVSAGILRAAQSDDEVLLASKRYFLSEQGPAPAGVTATTTYWVAKGAGDSIGERPRLTREQWAARALARAAAVSGNDPVRRVLIYVHGYNNPESDIVKRASALQRALEAVGFKGTVVSFDWLSNDSVLDYAGDRARARGAAPDLLTDCVRLFNGLSTPKHPVEVSVFAHSTGAYLTRTAYEDLERRQGGGGSADRLDHAVLVSADVTRRIAGLVHRPSLGPIIKNCGKLTNYHNEADKALAGSKAFRLGLVSRIGEEGIPPAVAAQCTDVDCTRYYYDLAERNDWRTADIGWGRFFIQFQKKALNPDVPFNGSETASTDSIRLPSHSWYFGDTRFAQDLKEVLQNEASAARQVDSRGRIELRP